MKTKVLVFALALKSVLKECTMEGEAGRIREKSQEKDERTLGARLAALMFDGHGLAVANYVNSILMLFRRRFEGGSSVSSNEDLVAFPLGGVACAARDQLRSCRRSRS